jgi:hypothetical protein
VSANRRLSEVQRWAGIVAAPHIKPE